MSNDDWRINDSNAAVHLLHQQKRVALEQRRPTIKKAADLVGPGIGAQAVRVTDLNDVLATYNGYFAAAQGAANAPTTTEPFIGYVIGDASLGGKQVFTGLSTNTEYTRTFLRNPGDASAILWSPWTGQRVPPAIDTADTNQTEVEANEQTTLRAPQLLFGGFAKDTFEASNYGIRIKKAGVYTGHVQVGANWVGASANVTVSIPAIDGQRAVTHLNTYLTPTFYVPFTFTTPTFAQAPLLSVSVFHVDPPPSGQVRKLWYRIPVVRMGDAT